MQSFTNSLRKDGPLYLRYVALDADLVPGLIIFKEMLHRFLLLILQYQFQIPMALLPFVFISYDYSLLQPHHIVVRPFEAVKISARSTPEMIQAFLGCENEI